MAGEIESQLPHCLHALLCYTVFEKKSYAGSKTLPASIKEKDTVSV
jgi:hypothetical protein